MARAQQSTINPAEAQHFGALAADWWDPKGSSAMLHQLNPVRLKFVREQIDAHWGGDARALRPLTGKSVLDVGCGAGLLCEPLARLGARVTGVDAAPENIAVAKGHAEQQGIDIKYLCAEVATLKQKFDLVCAMEVLEHVTDAQAFIAALVSSLKPGGLLILSTPNRTAKSKLIMVDLAEGLGKIPRGTHDWDAFFTPVEVEEMLSAQGMSVNARSGIAWSPGRGLHLSVDETLNYIFAATRHG